MFSLENLFGHSLYVETREAEACNEREKEMWQSGHLSDYTVQTGEGSFALHTFVLNRESTFFHTMFCERWSSNDARNGNMVLDEFDHDICRCVFEFMYLKQIGILERLNMNEMLRACDYFGMPTLKTALEESMMEHIRPENAQELMLLAQDYGLQTLEQRGVKFFKVNLSRLWIRSTLPVAIMEKIIQGRDFYIQDEYTLFKILVSFYEAKVEASASDKEMTTLLSLFEFVGYADFDHDQILQILQHREYGNKNELLRAMLRGFNNFLNKHESTRNLQSDAGSYPRVPHDCQYCSNIFTTITGQHEMTAKHMLAHAKCMLAVEEISVHSTELQDQEKPIFSNEIFRELYNSRKSTLFSFYNRPPFAIMTKYDVRCPFITWHFKNPIIPTAYEILSSEHKGAKPRTWKVLGSRDQRRWVLLRYHENDCRIDTKPWSQMWFKLDNMQFFNYFKLENVGVNSDGQSVHWEINAIKIHGYRTLTQETSDLILK